MNTEKYIGLKYLNGSYNIEIIRNELESLLRSLGALLIEL